MAAAAADTTTHTVAPPTPEMLRACLLLDEGKRRFLAADRFTLRGTTYEADDEAHLEILLCIRHFEAVILLGREDLVLIPSALVSARSLLDTAARACWLLEPDDPFERERRWMATLRERVRGLENLAKDCERAGADASRYRGELVATKRFADDVEAALRQRVPQYVPQSGTPSTEQLLHSFGRQDLYVFYRTGSQYTHGTQLATDLYRKDLGVKKAFGEFVSGKEWRECLQMSWWAVHEPGTKWLERMDVDPLVAWPREFVLEVDRAIDQVERAVNSALKGGRELRLDLPLVRPSDMTW